MKKHIWESVYETHNSAVLYINTMFTYDQNDSAILNLSQLLTFSPRSISRIFRPRKSLKGIKTMNVFFSVQNSWVNY